MYRPGAEVAVAAGTADAVVSAEVAIIRLIVRYLDRGMDAPDWAVLKLGQTQALRADALRVLRRLDEDLAIAGDAAVRRAYGTGARGAVADLPRGTARPPRALTAALTALGSDLVANVTGKSPRILRQVEDVYRDVIGHASATGVAGVETRRQVTERALAQFAARGVTGHVDRAGRQWGLETYTEMATRTAMVDASRAGYEDTLKASGRSLVFVIPGPTPCPDCDRWAGRILLLSGGTDPDGLAHTSEATARASGHLFGPNCGCGMAAYLPGISRPGEVGRSSPERYRARQEQRGIERHIREWKRREAATLTPEGRARARAKVAEWQGAMRDHLAAEPHLSRQSSRERVRPNG